MTFFIFGKAHLLDPNIYHTNVLREPHRDFEDPDDLSPVIAEWTDGVTWAVQHVTKADIVAKSPAYQYLFFLARATIFEKFFG